MNELMSIDKSFNKDMFITKANNIFVMLHHSIMMDDLDRVRHFISIDLENKYENLLKEYNSKNLRKMYDEMNVKTTSIKEVKIVNNKAIIELHLISRYMDYFIDKDTGNYVSGINDRRVEKTNYLTFEKTLGSTYNSIARSCPSCNANIDVNSNGKCSYCGTIFNTENYDWILIDIKTI